MFGLKKRVAELERAVAALQKRLNEVQQQLGGGPPAPAVPKLGGGPPTPP
jgi:hypothetical protein